jgi:hypothetical protein
MAQSLFPSLQGSEGFAITASDTLDIFNDPGNLTGVSHVFLHNRSAGGDVRVMPAGQRVPPVITLTGTAGTANITIKGIAYLVTFNTSLTQTAIDFVTVNAAALRKVDVTVVNITGAVLRFTGPAGILTIANATGDLSGTVATTATPITVYIPQGAVFPEAVSRVYLTSPAPPTNLVGLFGGSR